MSLPEISRRCLSCGASVRAGVRFCPQCGAAVRREAQSSADPNAADATDGKAEDAASLTPEVLKETFSTWESTSLHGGVSNARETGADRSTPEAERGGSENRPSARALGSALGATGNFGDAKSRSLDAAHRQDAQREPQAASTDATRAGDAANVLDATRNRSVEANAEAQPQMAGAAGAGAATDGNERAAGASAAGGAGEAGAKSRRRSVAVVEESLRPRVEKLRDVSVGMLDEAAEDSGLRFVVIAVVLFVIFLLFLLLNNSLK